MSAASVLRMLGPGLLMAGAAIGVSHLVQSTRAGAVAGFGLLPVILLANFTKYPGLSFGPRYTHATGFTLLEAYRRQGLITLSIFALLTVGTMFIIEAAVTFVTASLINAVVLNPLMEQVGGGHVIPIIGSIIVVAICTIVLGCGGFRWLDWLMKGLLSVMAVLTVLAVVLVLPAVEWDQVRLWPSAEMISSGAVSAGFIIALAGWMPAPLDISAWNSLWVLAHRDEVKQRSTRRQGAFDFNLGFTLCVILAVCFMILGSVLMYQPGFSFDERGPIFAEQVIDLFTASLGEWSRPIIAAAAIGVMFSTTLTVLDAIPRVLVVLVDRFRRSEAVDEERTDLSRTRGYWTAFIALAAGSLLIQWQFLAQFTLLVDIATTLAVMTTPFLAAFNHRAMFSDDVPVEHQPGRLMWWMSVLCIIALFSLALWLLWILLAL